MKFTILHLALFLLSVYVGQISLAQPQNKIESTQKWSNFFPYVPEKNEYYFEMGGMWEQENLSWFGFTYGRHIAECWFVGSEKCQQFLDFTVGVGHVQASTLGTFLIGPRWQYVMFPKSFSPSMGLFTGVMNLRDEDRASAVGVYGASLGLTMSIHKKLNVKWDNRLAGGDHLWWQSMVSFSLKIDDWVDQFSHQVGKIGDTTGSIFKSTISAPKTFIEWLNKPKDNPTNINNKEGEL